MLSAAVVIGALRINTVVSQVLVMPSSTYKIKHLQSSNLFYSVKHGSFGIEYV